MKLTDLIGDTSTIQVMDIGASCISEVPVYKKLLDDDIAHLNAFEGDLRQIEKIREFYGDKVSVFDYFLSDGTRQNVYIAAEASGMTSLLKPDPAALKFFNGFEQFGHVERIEEVQTIRLDDIAEVPPIDFLKMDIQGSELSVLEHGLSKLGDAVAIQLEISYIPLYEGQPTFGDIDRWMRLHGFAPHCFLDVKKWSIAPTIYNNDIRSPGNQLLESDIVYIKNPLRLDLVSAEHLRKLALVSHYCFGSYDLCAHVLIELAARNEVPVDTHNAYLAAINSQELAGQNR